MQFMFQYPDLNGPDPSLLDAGNITDIARVIEAAGWNGFSLTEHPAPGAKWLATGGHQTLDPFVGLSAAAAVTEKIKLLTFLIVLPYRNPLLTAKAAASLDLISNGRFILGVGTGYLKGEYHALGVDFEERNKLFDEALEVMPLHWAGEPFSYNGIHFNAREIQARPTPPHQNIPIWIGGNANITLKRVATKAHGWMPLLGSPELMQTTRTPAVNDLGERISSVKEMAGVRAKHLDFAVALPHEALSDIKGNAAEIKAKIDEFESAGATWIIVPAPWSPAPGVANWATQFAELFIK